MKVKNGFTLIELMVVLAVLAIIATIAVPGMSGIMDTNKLRGATGQYYADLQYARSESIKRNAEISVSMTADGGTSWCYGINETPGCDCTITDTADVNACTLTFSGVEVLKVAHSDDFSGVRVSSPSGSNITIATFNPTRGIATTTNSVVLIAHNNTETHVDVSVLGKISACTPAGDSNLAGYSLC